MEYLKNKKGTVTDFNYDTKKFNHDVRGTKFHEKCIWNHVWRFSGLGMFDIAFGTLTAGLGDYSVSPNGAAFYNIFKRNTNRSNRKNTGPFKNLIQKKNKRKRKMIVTPISFFYIKEIQGNPN